MCKDQTKLFRVEVDKDLIWSTYLNSFPEEERQEHNCNCCRQFIKNWGNVVAIKNNKVITFWDFKCEEPYKTVAKHFWLKMKKRKRLLTKRLNAISCWN